MQKDDKNILIDNLLDEALKTPPGFLLSENFAERMAEKMRRKFVWKQYIKEFFVYLATITGVFAIFIFMAFFWLEADWQKWQTFLLNNLSWIIGLNIIGLFVLFTDRVLLRFFFFRFSKHEIN